MIFSTFGNSGYIIHHPDEVEVYAVTREQLELISREAESDWKSRWQNAYSILITCLINVIALGWSTDSPSFRMNIGIGLVALIFGTVSLIFYILDRRRQKSRLTEILSQPVQTTSIKEEPL